MTSLPEKKKAAPPIPKAIKSSGDVTNLLSHYKGQIERALPKHLTAERMIQFSATLISRNPAIKECDMGSLVGAVMQASTLGFAPVNTLGLCYFVPFKNKKTRKKEVQFIIGYRGLIDLMQRSGRISNVVSAVVYANDEFHYSLGTDPKIHHVPSMAKERGEITHVYAAVSFKNGGFQFEVMSKADVDKIYDQHGNKSDFSPWKSHYEEMAKKTAIRRVAKSCPLSIDVMTNIETDGRVITVDAFRDDQQGVIDLDATEYPEPEPEAKSEEPSGGPEEEYPASVYEDEEPEGGYPTP